MFTLNEEQIEFIRQKVQEILEDPSDEAFAQAWLVWAELKVHTLDQPNVVQVVTRLMPLAIATISYNPRPIEEVHKILQNSLLRALIQAKLDDRDSLEMKDAIKAVLYVKNCSL